MIVRSVIGLAVLLLTLSGSADARTASAPSRFSPLDFFAGNTLGTGRLKKMLSSSEATLVHGNGVRGSDGSLVLDQTVEEGSKPVRHRQWHIRETTPGHYSGTLTDATSPIEGVTSGNVLTLRFKMKGGLDTRQVLTLAPDGQSARNLLTVRKIGIVVAGLDETIKRESQSGR